MVTLQRRFKPDLHELLPTRRPNRHPVVVDAHYTPHVADPSDGWRGQSERAGGGCIIDMGYHLVDMILWYFGLPDRVLASLSARARPDRAYDAEDTALIHFSYNGGMYGSLLLSRFIGPKREQIRLVGSKGIVELERGHLRRLTNGGEIIESLSRDQSWPSAATCQIDHFCRLSRGCAPISAARNRTFHLRFIAASYASAASGMPINPWSCREHLTLRFSVANRHPRQESPVLMAAHPPRTPPRLSPRSDPQRLHHDRSE
jgi:predicted dehydrogenase